MPDMFGGRGHCLYGQRPGTRDVLAAAILAAVRSEAVSNDAGPEQLLSIDRAAVLAGVGRTTIYAAIGAGRLRFVKVGRRRLVPASAIAELAGAEQATCSPTGG
jgi:excisionase family DNA binding protein